MTTFVTMFVASTIIFLVSITDSTLWCVSELAGSLQAAQPLHKWLAFVH